MVQTAEQEEERLCVICLVNDRDTTVLPCSPHVHVP